MKYLLSLVSLFAAQGVLAKTTEFEAPLTSFEITPKVCVATVVGDNCAMEVTLQWQTNRPADLCLYQNETELKCWQQSQKITETLPIQLQKQSTFTLIQQTDMRLLARQEILINYQINKRYRRRLRAEWSIF